MEYSSWVLLSTSTQSFLLHVLSSIIYHRKSVPSTWSLSTVHPWGEQWRVPFWFLGISNVSTSSCKRTSSQQRCNLLSEFLLSKDSMAARQKIHSFTSGPCVLFDLHSGRRLSGGLWTFLPGHGTLTAVQRSSFRRFQPGASTDTVHSDGSISDTSSTSLALS